MNQAIEQAIIDHTNKVWETALKVGMADERDRIMKLLKKLVEEINADYCCAEDDGNRLSGIAEAIALVKGETN